MKHTEPAFIEPMQCKPVMALPAGEKWTFETKFDGYRCIAGKRVREVTLRATRKCSTGAFPASCRRSHRSGVISFLDGKLSLRIHKSAFIPTYTIQSFAGSSK